jgi:hypothetical protein
MSFVLSVRETCFDFCIIKPPCAASTVLPIQPWYSAAATLPDGLVLIAAGWSEWNVTNPKVNNPFYRVYDPESNSLGSKHNLAQLVRFALCPF